MTRAAVPEIRCSPETRGPVVLGLLRPLLVVPEKFFRAREEDIAAALAHECVHIARWDFAKNLIYEFAFAMVAYHPASWHMRRRIAETREQICDEMAADTMGDRPEYAASLLRLALAMAAPRAAANHAIGVFDGELLEERIMRLTSEVAQVSRSRKIAMVALAASGLLGGAVAAMALPLHLNDEFQLSGPGRTSYAMNEALEGSRTKKETIYHVGNGVTPPVLTYSVDAAFTSRAKDAKYQGVSVVSCIVGDDGLPRSVHTVRKLGMGLDEKAIEAVRQYRFKPGTLNGKAVAVVISIELNFRIY